MPFTGNYEISLAGTSGSAYGATSGGPGYTFSKTVKLNYQDTVKIVLPSQPAIQTSAPTMTINGGIKAQLYVNDVLVWEAAGGAGAVSNSIAPNGITSVKVYDGDNVNSRTLSVHWHSGDGKSGASHSNNFPELYGLTNPGGCYTGSHVHDSYGYTCPRAVCGGHMAIIYEGPGDGPDGYDWHLRCDRCGSISYRHWQHDYTGSRDPGPRTCTNWYYTCGDLPYNKWNLGCNLQQGQILNIETYSAGPTYYASGWTPTASINNTGNAKFSIRLAEQQTVYYRDVQVKFPYYLDDKANLIILDNTVCFYKR